MITTIRQQKGFVWCKMTNQGEDLKYLTKEYWTRRWEGNAAQWHQVTVNPLLIKYIEFLDGGKKDLKIFVPLCGKNVDMKWLFDQGHRVVGVERYQNALEDFFKEHSMEYTTETRNGIPVFTEISGRIVLYCCNILEFEKTGEGSFDAVWDRASFGALNSGDRSSYVDLLTALKTPNAPQLMELREYDDTLFKETPFSIPMSKVLEYWGERYDVMLLESFEDPERVAYLNIDFKSYKVTLYLVTPKRML